MIGPIGILRRLDDRLVDGVFQPLADRSNERTGRNAASLAGQAICVAVLAYAAQAYWAARIWISPEGTQPWLLALVVATLAGGPVFLAGRYRDYEELRRRHERAESTGAATASPSRHTGMGLADRMVQLWTTVAALLFIGAIALLADDAAASLLRPVGYVLLLETLRAASLGVAAYFSACSTLPPAARRAARGFAHAGSAP